MVEPLNKLADQYDPYFFKVADPAKMSWYTQPDGNVYGYPNASSSPKDFEQYSREYTSNQTFVVRKDMYEALGKPDMRTKEGFLNALKLAKEKFPEVNGQPLIPLGLHEFTETGNYSLEGYLQNFLAVPYEKDGKLYDRATDPEYVSWLKTFRKANEMGLLAKDIFIDKRPQMEEKIAQGRYFAMLYQRSDFTTPQNALFAKDPNSVYIAVDGPGNEALDPPTLSGPGISGWTVTLISKNVKDKARAIRFLSYLISEEGQKDLFMGEPGVTYDTTDGKDVFKPEVLDMLNKDRSCLRQEIRSLIYVLDADGYEHEPEMGAAERRALQANGGLDEGQDDQLLAIRPDQSDGQLRGRHRQHEDRPNLGQDAAEAAAQQVGRRIRQAVQ